MLYHLKTQIVNSSEVAVDPAASITTEGMALVSNLINGIQHVSPSTGVAGEQFAGFSYGETVIPNTAPAVFSAIAAATQVLPHAPVGGTQVRITANGTPLTAAAAPAGGGAATAAAGTFVLAGQTLTLNAAEVGQTLVVTYRYALTAQQAQMLYGDGVVGQSAAALLHSTGVIKQGTVYTDQYDVTADYTAGAQLRLAPNGMITTAAGTGVALTGMTVVEVPSAVQPMLGVSLNVA